MERPQKDEFIKELQATFESSPNVVLTSYRGLTVNQSRTLRRSVRDAGGRYRVIKNRLAKRAAAGTHVEPLAAQFSGPCAVVTHESDPVGLAKVLADFAKDNPQVELVGAVVDTKDVIDAEGVNALSKLPGLPELRAQLLALFNTPGTQLVRLLGTPGTQVARVVGARGEKLESEG